MQAGVSRGLAATALALALAAIGGPAHGQGFGDAWRSAQQADASYRAARYELEAARYSVPIARSRLLPQLGISTSDGRISGTRETVDTTGSGSTPLDYNTMSRAVTLRVPVLNPEGWGQLNLSKAQVELAEATYLVRGKDLLSRLGKAYFELLFSMEAVALADQAVETYTEAVAYATRRFRGGEGTRTEVSEAEARLDLARADRLDARNLVEITRRALEVIAGVDTSRVAPPTHALRLQPPVPAEVDYWLALVEQRNPEVMARRVATEVTRRDVERARTGHYPRIDAVASSSRSENDSVNLLNTRISQNAVSLQFNLPLYAGGFVTASVDQAQALVRKSDEDLAAELNTQRVEARRQFLGAMNSLARVEAFQRAVSSSEEALEGAKYGYRAGIRTGLDVLNSQRQVFQSRLDLVRARYAFLQAMLQLKAVVGEPLDDVVEEIDRALTVPGAAPARG